MAENMKRDITDPVFKTPMTAQTGLSENRFEGTDEREGIKDNVLYVGEDNRGRVRVNVSILRICVEGLG